MSLPVLVDLVGSLGLDFQLGLPYQLVVGFLLVIGFQQVLHLGLSFDLKLVGPFHLLLDLLVVFYLDLFVLLLGLLALVYFHQPLTLVRVGLILAYKKLGLWIVSWLRRLVFSLYFLPWLLKALSLLHIFSFFLPFFISTFFIHNLIMII